MILILKFSLMNWLKLLVGMTDLKTLAILMKNNFVPSSNRLGGHSFKVEIRVRVPVGSPQKGRSEDLPFVIYADVVELADTQDLGSCASA